MANPQETAPDHGIKFQPHSYGLEIKTSPKSTHKENQDSAFSTVSRGRLSSDPKKYIAHNATREAKQLGNPECLTPAEIARTIRMHQEAEQALLLAKRSVKGEQPNGNANSSDKKIDAKESSSSQARHGALKARDMNRDLEDFKTASTPSATTTTLNEGTTSTVRPPMKSNGAPKQVTTDHESPSASTYDITNLNRSNRKRNVSVSSDEDEYVRKKRTRASFMHYGKLSVTGELTLDHSTLVPKYMMHSNDDNNGESSPTNSNILPTGSASILHVDPKALIKQARDSGPSLEFWKEKVQCGWVEDEGPCDEVFDFTSMKDRGAVEGIVRKHLVEAHGLNAIDSRKVPVGACGPKNEGSEVPREQEENCEGEVLPESGKPENLASLRVSCRIGDCAVKREGEEPRTYANLKGLVRHIMTTERHFDWRLICPVCSNTYRDDALSRHLNYMASQGR